MAKPTWTIATGLVSVLITCVFWSLVALSQRREVHYPGELGGMMITLLIGLALSLVAALKRSKWWFLAVAASLGTLITVVSRLH